MKQKVYIETSIVSYYTVNGLILDFSDPMFREFASLIPETKSPDLTRAKYTRHGPAVIWLRPPHHRHGSEAHGNKGLLINNSNAPRWNLQP